MGTHASSSSPLRASRRDKQGVGPSNDTGSFGGTQRDVERERRAEFLIAVAALSAEV